MNPAILEAGWWTWALLAFLLGAALARIPRASYVAFVAGTRRFLRRLPAFPLFVGIATGFGTASLAGAWISRQDVLRQFTRIHEGLQPASGFAPTVAQLRHEITAAVPRDRILVVVGGNSVGYGMMQSPDELWTRELQRLLGEPFHVVNFALPGDGIAGVGSVLFEVLAPHYPKSLYLGISNPRFLGYFNSHNPDFAYIFWDAWYRGWLPADASREQELRAYARAEWNDVHLDLILNRFFYFRDLWNYVAYQSLSTVVSPVTLGHTLQARRWYREPAIKRRDNFLPPSILPDDAAAVRAYLKIPHLTEGLESYLVERDGTIIPDPAFLEDRLRRYRLFLPPALRSRMLVALVQYNPLHRGYQTARERSLTEAGFDVFQAALQSEDIRAVVVGGQYAAGEFHDSTHLRPSGGIRLAEDLAPLVRELAERNGFLTPPNPPAPEPRPR